MNEESRDELNEEELTEQDAELLPDREEMTVIQPFERIGGGGYTMPIEPPATE
jgi:hypothetical protein